MFSIIKLGLLGLGEGGSYTNLTNAGQQAGQRSLPPSPADSGTVQLRQQTRFPKLKFLNVLD